MLLLLLLLLLLLQQSLLGLNSIFIAHVASWLPVRLLFFATI